MNPFHGRRTKESRCQKYGVRRLITLRRRLGQVAGISESLANVQESTAQSLVNRFEEDWGRYADYYLCSLSCDWPLALALSSTVKTEDVEGCITYREYYTRENSRLKEEDPTLDGAERKNAINAAWRVRSVPPSSV